MTTTTYGPYSLVDTICSQYTSLVLTNGEVFIDFGEVGSLNSEVGDRFGHCGSLKIYFR